MPTEVEKVCAVLEKFVVIGQHGQEVGMPCRWARRKCGDGNSRTSASFLGFLPFLWFILDWGASRSFFVGEMAQSCHTPTFFLDPRRDLCQEQASGRVLLALQAEEFKMECSLFFMRIMFAPKGASSIPLFQSVPAC